MQGSTLQLVIDHPEGVTVDHCADVSRQASAILDRDDYGASRYVLEVSSPGVERELYRPVDFARFVGEPLRITFRSGDGKKRTVDAQLEAFESTLNSSSGAQEATAAAEASRLALVIQTEDAPDRGETIEVPLRDVLRARLRFEF